MKKITKYTLGVVVLAGVTTAIAVPVSISVNSKQEVYSDEAPKITDPLFDGVVGDFIKENKEDEKVTTNFIKQSKNAQSYFLYKKEQIGSIELQKMDLKYQFYKKEKETEKLEKEIEDYKTQKTNNPNKKDLIEDLDKKIKANEDKIDNNKKENDKTKNLIEILEKPDELKYEDSSFSKDYPKIIMPIDKLEKDKKIQIDEEESAFGKNYRKQGDWKKDWIEELRKKYNGASSNEEAAKNSVVPTVNSIAENNWKIGINSDYTFEQTIAKYDGKLIYTGNDKIFKLNSSGKADVKISDKYDNIDVDTEKDEKKVNEKLSARVYFIGSKSKIPAEIFKKISKDEEVIKNVAEGHFATLQHALFDVKADAKDPTSPWTVKKELIKKLLEFKPGQVDGSTTGNHLRIEELKTLYKKSTDEKENEKYKIKTKNFIANATDNASSKTKSGLLKTGKLADVFSGWNPGFALGLIDNEIKAAGTPGDAMIDNLIKEFKTFAGNNTNQYIQNEVEKMTDKEINDKFGSMFRDSFSTNGAHKLSYRTTNGVIVFSANGIHYAHLDKYNSQGGKTVAEQIVNNIEKDLQSYANDPKDNTSLLDFPSLFQNFYTDASKFETLLSNQEFLKELEEGYKKDSDDKGPFDLPDQKNPDTDEKYKWSELIGSNGIFQEEIKEAEQIDGLEKAYKILSNGIQTYMLGGYDQGTLEIEATSSPIDIYNAALKIGRGDDAK
ncbi:MAG: hypothetical protein HRT99_00245 [Mycoplasmatales bacterium]|nr:hypothetical protein [Mycoplasmatales bacterium]